ncbi:potassium transporter Kup [Polynucleobacter paneuropaeus]|jgi:KUP system potassium uptake protein|uniref:Probable potassium transport system protein Kup n=1 Tax=Polynucleobacter paneuropaeus TaxID=2527775 RepID=A0ABX9F8Q0_9BURK|nr:potassium transporter Kup [Polynucleobacter paneuropaeus]AWW45869.1 potassium transporter Kup [Polynucleobacter paneuropaeus]AWW47713.1 potassium transporter Kup [Polynucleobacter paneuropaeus]MBT8518600.1 potassium transporter Kup [Polynucleobacter paneuropaeus]MBT8523842.1 potassium transporter Kup [Polynucleobacter paneuropaeus]MBT8527933.1 potassium transporter Kup [Polynucleobacter paneuropaeus]
MSVSNPEFSQSEILRPVEIEGASHQQKGSLAALALGAVGIVFGDIGTSPLYALKVCFDPVNGIPMTPDSIFGVISMIFWSFVMVVSLKYLLFVMRANNHGEGGILSLMALALRTADTKSKRYVVIMLTGVLGACLFYGDAVITPAISVLSAIEGTVVVSNDFIPYVLPITIAILLCLFLIEKKGTSVVGILFGPVMLIWFASLAVMGIYQIQDAPQIIAALNPIYAFRFMTQDAGIAFAVTGSIFLVLTGAEALYADMGHFGIRPIKLAWFGLVMPCLLINYFGQGAMLLVHPETITNPFFLMVPDAYTFALVILATIATVIASQACISGAYSMTSEAILLGFLPRMKILFTSAKEKGQIYVPFINWMLCFIVIGIVLAFKKSDNLASAYGVAVSTTMLLTTLLAAVVMKALWKWNAIWVTLIIGCFLIVDLGFFTANLTKLLDGGWFPVVIASICFLLMMTWYQGRQIVRKRVLDDGIRLDSFMTSLLQNPPHRVEGTAVFLTAHVDYLPVSFLHNLKHNHILHERVFFLKVSIWDVPYVDDDQRLTLKELGPNIYVVRAVYGFKETPDSNQILDLLESQFDLKIDKMNTSFFLSRDTIIPTSLPGMAIWREVIFAWMYQNAGRQSDFFKIPANRVVELGAKVEI